jgi:hypothetical protein
MTTHVILHNLTFNNVLCQEIPEMYTHMLRILGIKQNILNVITTKNKSNTFYIIVFRIHE